MKLIPGCCLTFLLLSVLIPKEAEGLAPLLVLRTGEDLSQVFLWLGITFACVLIPCSLLLSDPPVPSDLVKSVAGPAAETAPAEDDTAVRTYLGSQQFVFMWIDDIAYLIELRCELICLL